ncbi:MAG: glycosyltransferase family 2 protein [Candidatus Nomurabacteria bacterium]|nr:MAG: glycosyltransferase family 2 protein [Candidatus Nomurabacteria bacterium]
MSNPVELSIVLPAYNEAKRLPPSLETILEYFPKHYPDLSYEVVVVDDGSTDGTARLAAGYGKPVRVHSVPHGGKGAAVKAGMLEARGVWVLLTDTDLSTPIQDFAKFWPERKQYDVLIGSRALPEADITVRQSSVKVTLGRIGNKLIQWLAVSGIEDTQCGFKLYSKRCRMLFQKQQLRGWGFDFEILFLAKKFHFTMKEIPVTWKNDFASKVRPSDYIKTFWELLSVRYHDILGHYR